MTQLINSAFKVKAGSVPDIYLTKPEAGAIAISEADGRLYVSDGYNWLQVQPANAAIALKGTGLAYALVAATPVNPADWFNTQLSVYGSSITSTPNTIVTLVDAATYLLNYDFQITGDTAGSEFKLKILNGLTTVFDIDRLNVHPGTPYNSFGSVYIVAGAGDVLTAEVESDVDSNWEVQSRIGISKLT